MLCTALLPSHWLLHLLNALANAKLNVTPTLKFVFFKEKKTLWLKEEKMLVTSIFSFSHKSPLSQGHQNAVLCGGSKDYKKNV